MSCKIIIFIILSFLTIFCHKYIDRYKKNGGDMLSDNWSFYTPKSGKALIKDKELYLFSADKNKSVSIQQNIPFFVNGSILKLSADIKCARVVPGKKSWNHARLLLVQNDGHKNRWDKPSVAASLTGSKAWKRYSTVFIVGHDTKSMLVSAQLNRCTGSFRLKNIRLFPVIQTKIYTWIKKIILISWAAFAFFVIGSCIYCSKENKESKENIAYCGKETAAYYRKKMLLFRIMLALSFIAIIIGTTMPGDMKVRILNEVQSKISIFSWNLSKMGHFCFFAFFSLILSVLLSTRQSGQVITVALNILLIAGGTELAQSFIDGRTPLFMDFFVDSAGGLTGILLCNTYFNFIPNMKKIWIKNTIKPKRG